MSENHLFLQLFGRTSHTCPVAGTGSGSRQTAPLCNLLKWPVNSTREVIVKVREQWLAFFRKAGYNERKCKHLHKNRRDKKIIPYLYTDRSKEKI